MPLLATDCSAFHSSFRVPTTLSNQYDIVNVYGINDKSQFHVRAIHDFIYEMSTSKHTTPGMIT